MKFNLSKKEQLKYIIKGKSDKKSLKKECAELWREIVVKKAKDRCEYYGCYNTNKLNAHHFYTKGGHENLRYDPDNGICLCYYHHKGKEGAHSDPDFKEKILGRIDGYRPIRTEEWYKKLQFRANSKCKQDLKLELIYLQGEFKKFKI